MLQARKPGVTGYWKNKLWELSRHTFPIFCTMAAKMASAFLVPNLPCLFPKMVDSSVPVELFL